MTGCLYTQQHNPRTVQKAVKTLRDTSRINPAYKYSGQEKSQRV